MNNNLRTKKLISTPDARPQKASVWSGKTDHLTEVIKNPFAYKTKGEYSIIFSIHTQLRYDDEALSHVNTFEFEDISLKRYE